MASSGETRPSRRASSIVASGAGSSALPGEAASHLFQVISRRYEHGSIILTTNRGIADWGAIFDDTTVAAAILLDRLLHHATVLTITGDSYRMRRHRDAMNGCSGRVVGDVMPRSAAKCLHSGR